MLAERANNTQQPVVEPREDFLADVRRHAAIKCLGNPAGDARQRVAVATEGNRLADGILEIFRCQKGDQGRWHRPLARDVERIAIAQLVEGFAQLIAERVLHEFLDVRLARARSGQEYRRSGGLGAFPSA